MAQNTYQLLAIIFGVAAALGQLINILLNLRIRAAQLETEKRIMNQVENTYVRKDVFGAMRRQKTVSAIVE